MIFTFSCFYTYHLRALGHPAQGSDTETSSGFLCNLQDSHPFRDNGIIVVRRLLVVWFCGHAVEVGDEYFVQTGASGKLNRFR